MLNLGLLYFIDDLKRAAAAYFDDILQNPGLQEKYVTVELELRHPAFRSDAAW
ncbi:MAG: hypothetical protein ACREM1_09270 [Longimicrobiales bacterium]